MPGSPLAWRPPSLNQCLPTELDSPETLYLHDMAFAPAVRWLGAGKALLGRLIAHAKQLGVPHLSLVAAQGAESFWKKQGFEHTHTTKSLGSYTNPHRRLISSEPCQPFEYKRNW
ncbi:MAG: GNAT family N-acetyltransferase [Shewanella sp.]|nr:GNAT family N-acetyltransferase [Shewanella sp.]MCF1457531.1 GNAT family N-acetyltransferase [Shewanella sp.]